jgi:hypothetical protein
VGLEKKILNNAEEGTECGLKAVLYSFVTDEQVLESPEGLRGKTTAQIGSYAHRCQGSRTSNAELPHKLLATLPPEGESGAVDRPEGSPEEISQVLWKTC